MRKTFKIGLSLILTINTLLVFQNPVSADFIKEVAPIPPDLEANAGDDLFVQIQLPGGTTMLRNPADTMLVMDRTGSMGSAWFGTTRIQAAKNALKAFVDQTHEDGGPTDPGDYVGLVTYSTPSTITCLTAGVFDQFKCSSLDFSIANMTNGQPPFVPPLPEPDNKTAIKTAIDSFLPGYNTPIGAGMNLANKELLNQVDKPGGPPSSSRAGVRKYMVLATDGQQNTYPAPIDLGILQTSIDNNIMVFTVAIGGGFGFGLLREVACKTDWFDPDNPCKMVGDADPNTNDINSPRNFFVANDPNALTTIYEAIANRIAGDYWYRVLDQINPTVFDAEGNSLFTGIVQDPANPTGFAFSVTDCTGLLFPDTGPPLPAEQITDLKVFDYAFTVLLKNIGKDKVACINFRVHINEAWSGPDGSYAVDDPNIRRAGVWDPKKTCWMVWGCIIKMIPFPNNIGEGWIDIVNPAKPWLQTTGGDVGSFGPIDPILRDLLDPDANAAGDDTFNADYLVISQEGIDSKFRSVKNWLVPGYSGLTIPPLPLPPASIYNDLLTRYTNQCGPVDRAIIDANEIDKAGDTCNIYRHTGDLTVNNSSWSAGPGYDRDVAIVFVTGDMIIERDIVVAPNTGLIFIVQGNIRVVWDLSNPSRRVEQIDGIFITDGIFNTYGGVACDSTSSSEQLVINGAVYAFGQACFTRALANNRDTPAELINFEPKYLYLFQEIIGDTVVIYREVAP